MNKKYLKIGALVVAGALIVGLGLFANALLGNPISKAAAASSAKKYVAETYAGTDYYVEKVSYNFKDGNYHAFVKSPSSIDTEFSLYVSMIGKIHFDTYENVTSGYNTACRLEQEYRVLVDTVLESTTFPYAGDIRYGTLEIFPEEYLNNPEITDVPAYALNQNELELDKMYNVRELGSQAGHIVIYVDDEVITVENAADMMLKIKKEFDAAGVPFAAMDFTLQHTRPEDGVRADGEIHVANFLAEDIHEEGMAKRVEKAHQELTAYYEAENAKK